MGARDETLQARVLLLTPIGRDAELACAVLRQDQLSATPCSRLEDLLREMNCGAGAAVIADEVLTAPNVAALSAWVQRQPAWSDFPFVVLTRAGISPAAFQENFRLIRQLGNFTLLERPLRSITLLTVVRTALRARARQYEVEHYIEEARRVENERAQAYAREEAALAQIELLNHIGSILSAEPKLDPLLQAVTDAGTALSGADLGAFYCEDLIEQSGAFTLRCASGLTVESAAATLGANAGLHAAGLQNHRLIRWPDAGVHASADAAGALARIAAKLVLRNALLLPVASRHDSPVGVLLLGRLREAAFTDRDERVVTSLASQAAIAIENARLFALAERERRRLEAIRGALQRSNEELRQFAYVASHDLQEPLRTIASFTQLLVNRRAGQAPPEELQYVNYVVEGVERMSALIHDLLEYSRTGAAREPLTEPASVQAALDEVIFTLSASIRESGAEITYDSLPAVWIDHRSLVQLFQNLVGNAIKYRGPNPLRVHVSVQAAGEDWCFAVRDNGIGVAPEYQKRIFGIFKRLHGREIPGTGIGLAICQRIVEWHGGRIWVESEPGSGATFFFTVPREAQRAQRDMAEYAVSSGS